MNSTANKIYFKNQKEIQVPCYFNVFVRKFTICFVLKIWQRNLTTNMYFINHDLQFTNNSKNWFQSYYYLNLLQRRPSKLIVFPLSQLLRSPYHNNRQSMISNWATWRSQRHSNLRRMPTVRTVNLRLFGVYVVHILFDILHL